MDKTLHTKPGIDDPDDFYANLIMLHSGLSSEQSQRLNSKLVLMMANQIGNQAVLDQIFETVRTNQAKY